MAYQPEENEFAPIYQLEIDDLVLGGLGGLSNLPLKQLASRTLYLKTALETLESGGGPFDYNASGGTLPAEGSDGPGVMGIRRKDYYFVTTPGVVFGVTLQKGDALIAMVDDADDISEFIISQSNAELATPTVIGMVKLVQNLTGGSEADACLSVAGLLNLFAQKASPALTGTPTTSTPADADNTSRIANTAWVLARLVAMQGVLQNNIDGEVTARQGAITSEANARIAADNTEITARQNAITGEANTRSAADTNEANARIAADNNLNSIKANKSQPGWQDLPLQNGWTGGTGTNKPQFRVDEFGGIHLKGILIASGSTSRNAVPISSLPIPYGAATPVNILIFRDDVAPCYLEISGAGSLAIPVAMYSTARQYHLFGISYWAN